MILTRKAYEPPPRLEISGDLVVKDNKVMEILINGKKQYLESEFPNTEDLNRYELIIQTEMHGLWVDGYMFNNHSKIRKVYREL